MKQGRHSVKEDLAVAFRTELAGHAFYKHAAEAVTDERGKSVFSHLAKEELEHIYVISAIGEAIKKGESWLSYKEALGKGSTEIKKKGLPIFPGDNEMIKKLKENQTDLNAVMLALGVEEKAVDFYGGMLKAAVTPDEKVCLTELFEMEKGHLKVLRWEYESIVKTGFWGDFMEYNIEKELE
ncbi:MAG: ferritin family protein [Deltaproteobacteria bacterium]|nr:ferritin family protein [Deltaproteobacteria bacterium]